MRDLFPIPDSLLRESSLPTTAKYLYLVALGVKPMSITEWSRELGKSRPFLSRSCNLLSKRGWLKLVRSAHSKLVVPCIPDAVEYEAADLLRRKRAVAGYLGEFLMRMWLDRLVASGEYVDNARPDFLRNPKSKQNLEYDRYYLIGVAFEFNGDQHYMETDFFPRTEELEERQIRDLVKAGLSQKRHVILVEMTEEDLTLQGMLAKIPDVLPLNQVNEDSPYVRALTELSQEYRENVRRRRARSSSSKPDVR